MKRVHMKIKALMLALLVFSGTIQAPVQAVIARAEEPVKISYQAFNNPTAWVISRQTIRRIQPRRGTYMTGFQAELLNQPQNVTGGPDISGGGGRHWLDGMDGGKCHGRPYRGRCSAYCIPGEADRRTEQSV